MKWEIFHRTRYQFLSPVRDSFNNICLQPMHVPEQTVESFILKILPASRLTHSSDLFSNLISRFEISEPHSYLVIEAQSCVSTHPPAPLPAADKLCPFEVMQAEKNLELWADYLPASRFVAVSSEAWKLAVDATHG